MKLEQQAVEKLYDFILKDEIGKQLYTFHQKEIYPTPKHSIKFVDTIEYCLYNIVGFKDMKPNLIKKEIRNELLNKKRVIKQRIKRLKTSLITKISEPNGNIQNDIKAMFSINKSNPNTLMVLYSTVNSDEYIDRLLKEQEEWLTNNDLLINHPYSQFAGEVKVDWYYLDLAIVCLEYILANDSNFINFSSFYANDLIDMPFFSPSPTSIPSSELRYDTTQALEHQAIFNINENSEMIIQSTKDDKGNVNQIRKYKTLDSKDFEILNKILIYLDKNFVKTGEINFNIVDIAKAVFNTDKPSKKNYDTIVERLDYIRCVQFRQFDALHNQTRMYSLIDEVLIDHNLNIGKVKFGERIVQNFLDRKLTFVTANHITQSTSSFAKRLGLVLQRERMIAGTGTDNKYIATYDYSFFKSKFIFISKSFKKNWQMIIEALNELANEGTIINDYTVKTDNSIEIHFKKLTSSEIVDLDFYEQNIFELILEEPKN